MAQEMTGHAARWEAATYGFGLTMHLRFFTMSTTFPFLSLLRESCAPLQIQRLGFRFRIAGIVGPGLVGSAVKLQAAETTTATVTAADPISKNQSLYTWRSKKSLRNLLSCESVS